MRRIAVVLLLAAAFLVPGHSWGNEAKTGSLSGQLRITGDMPMAEGLVYIYNLATGPAPSRDRYWRVPDFVEKLDANGRFTLDLPPGQYCVGAIKRQGPTQIGPPLEGDYFIIGLDGNNMPKKYVIAKGEKQDIGVIVGALPYKPQPLREGSTAVEGTVVDPEGKPVEGAMIFAFLTPTIVGKPLFVSNRSGKDGKFLLRLHEGGTYYLKVRDSYGGGPPRSGAVLDGRKEEQMEKVTLKAGEIVTGVKVLGRRFPGRGPSKE